MDEALEAGYHLGPGSRCSEKRGTSCAPALAVALSGLKAEVSQEL